MIAVIFFFKDIAFQTITSKPSVAVKRSHSYVDDATKKNRIEEGKNSSIFRILSAKILSEEEWELNKLFLFSF